MRQAPQPPPREDDYSFAAIDHLVDEANARENAILKQLDRWGATPHVVVYEDLIADFAHTVRSVLDVLKLDRGRHAMAQPAFAPVADSISRTWRERYLSDRQRLRGRS